VPLCIARGSQYHVALASDGAGGAIAVWEDYRRGGEGDIYAQRITASGALGWAQDGVPVCTDTAAQMTPAVAADGAGGALIVWEDHRGGSADLFIEHLTSAGAPVSGAGGGHRLTLTASVRAAPVMMGDVAGGAYLAWEGAGASGGAYAVRLGSDGQ